MICWVAVMGCPVRDMSAPSGRMVHEEKGLRNSQASQRTKCTKYLNESQSATLLGCPEHFLGYAFFFNFLLLVSIGLINLSSLKSNKKNWKREKRVRRWGWMLESGRLGLQQWPVVDLNKMLVFVFSPPPHPRVPHQTGALPARNRSEAALFPGHS